MKKYSGRGRPKGYVVDSESLELVKSLLDAGYSQSETAHMLCRTRQAVSQQKIRHIEPAIKQRKKTKDTRIYSALKLERRIEAANQNIWETNCIGTALWFAGARKRDRSFSIEKSKLLEYVRQVSVPHEGGLISWEIPRGVSGRTVLIHLAYIDELKPFTLVHRVGGYEPSHDVNGHVAKESFDEVDKIYKKQGVVNKYYIPIQLVTQSPRKRK